MESIPMLLLPARLTSEPIHRTIVEISKRKVT
jgi:hypothetical protein